MRVRRAFIVICALLVISLLVLISQALRLSRGHGCPAIEAERHCIKSALEAFRYEYSRWPCASTQAEVRLDDSASLPVILSGTTNSEIAVEMNPRHIRFINLGDFKQNAEGAIVTQDGDPFHILVNHTGDYCRVWYDKPKSRFGGCQRR